MARRVIGGFIGASAVAFGSATLVLGSGLMECPLQIPRMWQAVQGLQPDIAAVESFFYPGLHGWPKMAALLLTMGAAAGYTGWALRRAPDPLTRGLTLLLVWLAALPFVPSYDMILLLPAGARLPSPPLPGRGDPLVRAAV